MKFKAKKKGFTIVELVVVIAVIAVLAAVLIPTFSNIVKKAQKSSDTQLVRNLNTALALDDKEHKTMQSALDAAKEGGFDVGKINSKISENEILWDSKNDVFCYLNDDRVEYVPNSVEAEKKLPANDYRLWKIYGADETIPAASEQKYSIYYNGAAWASEAYTVSVGFDAGKGENITSVTYARTGGEVQNVAIRTNSYDTVVTVNAPADTVRHYDKANKIDVTAVAPASYHEYGDILGRISLASGRVVAENGAKASAIVITATVEQINDPSAPVVISADNTAAPEIPIIVPSDVKTEIDAKAQTDSHYGITTSDQNSLVSYDSSKRAYVLGKGSYATLLEALGVAEFNDTVILLQDCTLDSGLGFGGITLDLGGNTITYSGEGYALSLYFETVIKNGTIVVGNNGVKPDGCISIDNPNQSIKANVELVNLTLKQQYEDNRLYTVFNNNADLTIRHCTLQANNGIAIYAWKDANLSVSNTTIISSAKGAAGIKYEWAYGNGNIVIGEKVVINNFTTGIEIKEPDSVPTYTIDESVQYVGCDEGLQIVEKSSAPIEIDSTDTLQAAFAAAKSGDTIKLVDNVTLTAAVTMKDGVTLDLDGHTLTVSMFEGGGHLVIGDSAVTATISNGTIVRSGGSGQSVGIVQGVSAESKITFDKVTINCGGDPIKFVEVAGGNISFKQCSITNMNSANFAPSKNAGGTICFEACSFENNIMLMSGDIVVTLINTTVKGKPYENETLVPYTKTY